MDDLTPNDSRSENFDLPKMDRRRFVRAGGGVLAVTILGIGCDDDGISLVPQGTLRVVVTGHGSGAAGSVRLVNENLDATVAVPANGIGEQLVPIGTYTLTYTPPSGYVLGTGQNAQQNITITAGATSQVSFAVVQPPAGTGTARIVVTGLVAGATAGGTAVITPTGGGAATTVNVPATGTANVSVAVGTYSVAYTPPAGHGLATGQTGQANLTITAGQTAIATFQVQQTQPGTLQPIFFSNWSAATGNSTAAKTDGGKWNIISDPGNSLDVVAGPPVGIPSPNCLRVIAKTSAQGFARLAKTGLGVPAVGQSFFYRWYYRHEQPSLNDNSQHPIESGQTGGLDWSFSNETISNTTWRPEFRPGGDQNNAVLARFTGPILQRSVTYRFELQIHKLSNTEMRMHARVYSAAGQLIADDDDFINDRLGSSTRVSLADNPTLHFQTSGGSQLDEVRAGNNGISVGDWGPEMLYAYQGGFAIATGDWCGPYGNIAGET
jgi:hypothetical protein